MEWIPILLVDLFLGSIAAGIAPSRGFDRGPAFIAGCLLPVITIVYLLLQPDIAEPPLAQTYWPTQPPKPVPPANRAAAALHDLADLHDRGAVTDAEFEAKKRELLARM